LGVQTEQQGRRRHLCTQAGKHGFDAGLNERIHTFRTDAQLNCGASPQVELRLLITVELKGRRGRIHCFVLSLR
jgi:hypothetical protein